MTDVFFNYVFKMEMLIVLLSKTSLVVIYFVYKFLKTIKRIPHKYRNIITKQDERYKAVHKQG